HLERRAPGRLRQRVGVAPDEQRTVGALVAPVLDDRGGDRDDVRLVERMVQAGPAVPGGAEDDLLRRVVRVRGEVVVGADHLVDVDQVTGLGGGSGTRIHAVDTARNWPWSPPGTDLARRVVRAS